MQTYVHDQMFIQAPDEIISNTVFIYNDNLYVLGGEILIPDESELYLDLNEYEVDHLSIIYYLDPVTGEKIYE